MCKVTVPGPTCFSSFIVMKHPGTLCYIISYVTMRCNNSCATAAFKTRSQQLLAIWMAITSASIVDGDMKQLTFCGKVDLLSMQCMCTMRCVFSTNRGRLITKIYTPLHYRLPGNSSIEALEVALPASCAVWEGHCSSLVINREGLIRQILLLQCSAAIS